MAAATGSSSTSGSPTTVAGGNGVGGSANGVGGEDGISGLMEQHPSLRDGENMYLFSPKEVVTPTGRGVGKDNGKGKEKARERAQGSEMSEEQEQVEEEGGEGEDDQEGDEEQELVDNGDLDRDQVSSLNPSISNSGRRRIKKESHGNDPSLQPPQHYQPSLTANGKIRGRPRKNTQSHLSEVVTASNINHTTANSGHSGTGQRSGQEAAESDALGEISLGTLTIGAQGEAVFIGASGGSSYLHVSWFDLGHYG